MNLLWQIKQFKRIFRFYRFLRPYSALLWSSIILQGVGITLGLVNPIIYKHLIDDVLISEMDNKSIRSLLFWITIFILIKVFMSLSGIINQIWTSKIRNAATMDLENHIYKTTNALPASYHDKHPGGEILPRIFEDPAQVIDFLASIIPMFIESILQSIFIFIIVSAIKWWAAIAALAPAIPLLFFASFNIKQFKTFSDKMFEIQQNLYLRVLDIMTALKLVRLFRRVADEEARFINDQKKLLKIQMDYVKRMAILSPLINVIGKTGGGLVFILGALEIIHQRQIGLNDFTLGALFMLMGYIWQLASPLSIFGNMVSAIGSTQASADRLSELLEGGEHLHPIDQPTLISEAFALEFRNVEFGYQDGQTIFKDLSFILKSGEKIGIMGANGAGKTTITSLACGFYRPRKGSVLISGVTADSIINSSIPQPISLASQDALVIHGSIYDNLTYGNRQPSDFEIDQVLELLKSRDFIDALPEKIHARIGEGAVILSHGQRQRIALGRALLSHADIYIFDEATSHIDVMSEMAMIQGIFKYLHNKSIIWISHRPYIMSRVDRILYLKQDELIEGRNYSEIRRRTK